MECQLRFSDLVKVIWIHATRLILFKMVLDFGHFFLGCETMPWGFYPDQRSWILGPFIEPPVKGQFTSSEDQKDVPKIE